MNRCFNTALLIMVICITIYHPGFSAETINFGNSRSGIELISQDQSGMTLKIDVGAINLDKITRPEGTFTTISVDGFSRSHEIGEPSLPMINRLIAIPFGCETIRQSISKWKRFHYPIIISRILSFLFSHRFPSRRTRPRCRSSITQASTINPVTIVFHWLLLQTPV